MRLTKLRQVVAGTMAAALLAGCGTSVASDSASTSSSSTSTGTSTSAVVATDATTVEEALADDIAVEAGDTDYDESDATTITLAHCDSVSPPPYDGSIRSDSFVNRWAA